MKKLRIVYLLCIGFWIISVDLSRAGQLAVSMAKDQVSVGETLKISLVLLPGGAGESLEFPDEIVCELNGGGQKIAVLAKKLPRQEKSATDSHLAGVRQDYSFQLPNVLLGQVVLSFQGLEAPRVVFDVVLPEKDSIASSEKVYPTLDSMFNLYQPYQKNVSAYQPVYFLVGTEPEKSKFQISFKYRFFDEEAPFAKTYPWVKGLHFGYTQTSFWDLASASAPFEDTGYKPELFWLSRNYLGSEHGLLKGVFFQGGIQHESNGRAADISRSTNYLYARPMLIFYDDDSKLGLMLAPKIWSYVANDADTNPDLADYRGYFDLETKFGQAEGFVAGIDFRWAEQGASFQLDFSYPLHKIFGNVLDVYFYAQYSNVLAESLLDYQDRTQAVRLGLAFIR